MKWASLSLLVLSANGDIKIGYLMMTQSVLIMTKVII